MRQDALQVNNPTLLHMYFVFLSLACFINTTICSYVHFLGTILFFFFLASWCSHNQGQYGRLKIEMPLKPAVPLCVPLS